MTLEEQVYDRWGISGSKGLLIIFLIVTTIVTVFTYNGITWENTKSKMVYQIKDDDGRIVDEIVLLQTYSGMTKIFYVKNIGELDLKLRFNTGENVLVSFREDLLPVGEESAVFFDVGVLNDNMVVEIEKVRY